jgi:hypothetical protein
MNPPKTMNKCYKNMKLKYETILKWNNNLNYTSNAYKISLMIARKKGTNLRKIGRLLKKKL